MSPNSPSASGFGVPETAVKRNILTIGFQKPWSASLAPLSRPNVSWPRQFPWIPNSSRRDQSSLTFNLRRGSSSATFHIEKAVVDITSTILSLSDLPKSDTCRRQNFALRVRDRNGSKTGSRTGSVFGNTISFLNQRQGFGVKSCVCPPPLRSGGSCFASVPDHGLTLGQTGLVRLRSAPADCRASGPTTSSGSSLTTVESPIRRKGGGYTMKHARQTRRV